MNVQVLLKMAGLPYQTKCADVREARKKKLPFIKGADGTVVADSTLIRFHLERVHEVDLHAGLIPAERGTAWAFEKLCDDNLYWVVMRERWLADANFDKGPRHFLDELPAPLRPLIAAMFRRDVRKAFHGQGLGRHSQKEMVAIAARGIEGLAHFLGDKQFLMGDKSCGADAFVWPTVTHLLSDFFETPSGKVAARHANLIAYRDHGMAKWFAEFASASA
jgi:glutathione S-transferase